MNSVKAQPDVKGLADALDVFEGTLDHIHMHAHDKKRPRRWAPVLETAHFPEEQLSPLSVSAIVAVAVDAMVDGLLIGLAYIASHTAGISMAIATCIEMGFLGVSFSNQVKSSVTSASHHFAIVLIPPLSLVAAGIVGDLAGQELVDHQYLFIGFIGFATVAVLFLVTEELLSEANEVSEGAYSINVCFFLGLYSGLIMDKALG
eukprot:TRINITY_DN2607_c0_g1_i1.p1 TRINITY_DN2607_c0_g1~~TRINITY_DN2607_c0_g1_i1.p1  ORF type:complete len:204 (+),score=43.63 TRINITY_DN2607_c0_g1_i1:112-723(+)